MRGLLSILGTLFLLGPSQFANAEVTVVDLTTTNLMGSGVIVQTRRIEGDRERFTVIVTPRGGGKPGACTGRLWLRDGQKEIASCDVAGRQLPKESKEVEEASVVFEFEVAGGYVTGSAFTLTWMAPRGIASAFAFRLRLQDFHNAKDHDRRHELPMFGELPRLDERWRVREQGTNSRWRSSWIILTNSQSGDMLSFAADEIAGKVTRKINRIPETFPGGYPAWNKPAGEDFTVHWMKSEVVDLSTVDGQKSIEQEALEYAVIYEQKPGTNRLAHGYALAFGSVRVVVQHTSTTAITSELAHEMASGLMVLHSKRKAAH